MTATPSLGALIQADLREAWNHEAHSFTPWLAENLDTLSTVIGIPMELEGSEVAVEQFSADILARNPQTDELVLIENQLEGSDHSHLGQIMTYLAGLDARIVIWVAAGFRDAHLSAVNWLNEHTDGDFNFFAVQVRVVRIGDSLPAPIFDVVARPNAWERHLHEVARTSKTLSEIGQFRLGFWEEYVRHYPDEALYGPANADSTRTRPIDGVDLIIKLNVAKDSVGIFVRGLMGADGKAVHTMLEPHAAHLSAATGAPFTGSRYDHFFGQKQSGDATDRTQWPALFDWLHSMADIYVTAIADAMR